MIRNERDKMQIYGRCTCDVFDRSAAPRFRVLVIPTSPRGGRGGKCVYESAISRHVIRFPHEMRKKKKRVIQSEPRDAFDSAIAERRLVNTLQSSSRCPAAVTAPVVTAAGVSVHETPSRIRRVARALAFSFPSPSRYSRAPSGSTA